MISDLRKEKKVFKMAKKAINEKIIVVLLKDDESSILSPAYQVFNGEER